MKKVKKVKKAQIQSQIFVYVLAMIVITVVLLYGYKNVKLMGQRADEIDLLSFKNDISNIVEKVSNDYGTVRKPNFKIPSDIEEVCFVDLGKGADPGIVSEHPLVYDAWQDDSANVFLIHDLAEEFHLVGEDPDFLIQIDGNGLRCFNVVNNHISVRLEGVGGKVKLS